MAPMSSALAGCRAVFLALRLDEPPNVRHSFHAADPLGVFLTGPTSERFDSRKPCHPMAETPEIPESNDPFSRQVAITIAILAVVLAVIENKGDNAKTDAILKTSEAANRWGYYQSKSIKQNLHETELEILASLGPSAPSAGVLDPALTAAKERATAAARRYDSEKGDIKKEAERFEAEAATNGRINDRCDHAALALQIAVVICSVAILSRWRLFWYIGLGLGVAGSLIGLSAYLL